MKNRLLIFYHLSRLNILPLKSAWFDGEEQKAGAVASVFFHFFNQVF